jgi:3-(methylthio)propanoyl-CoA dehydrogenase
MSYIAPLDDMRFVLNHLAGLPEIAALPGLEDAQPELVEAILTEAARFACEVLGPLNATGDRQGCRWADGKVSTPDGFPQAYRQFIDAGWNGMPASADIGGQGLPAVVSSAVAEMWKSANLAFSLCQMLTMGAVHALEEHASDEIKQRFLPRLVTGEWTGTMNLTEPQAGSDLSAVRMRAEPDGEAHRLFGSKIFITWGEHDVAENIIHLVLARLPDAPPGTRGISLFVAPKFLVNPDGGLGVRNDLICSSIEHKLGIHGSPTAVMSYGDDKGAVAYLVGAPNHGLEYMFTMMNHSRLNVGLEGVAVSEAAYQTAVRYARERIQGRPIGSDAPAPIIHHPDVQRMLMDMKARTEAMRALAYCTAACMDRALHHPDAAQRAQNQGRLDLLTPVVKGWCTENSIMIASAGMQVHGGVGYVEETGAAQYLRDARITTIYEGTTGIQANDLIGRKLARDKGVNAGALISDMNADLDALEPANDVDLVAIRFGLSNALVAFREATDWMLANHDSHPREAAAGAVPYLKLMGTVTGGWQMARAARIAHRLLGTSEENAGFLRAKIGTARFYASHAAWDVQRCRPNVRRPPGWLWNWLALEKDTR